MRYNSTVFKNYFELLLNYQITIKVWIVWGDGSCGYSIAEYDTFTRFKLPVMALVGNDAGWTQILREQVTILGTEVACKLSVNYIEKDIELKTIFHDFYTFCCSTLIIM